MKAWHVIKTENQWGLFIGRGPIFLLLKPNARPKAQPTLHTFQSKKKKSSSQDFALVTWNLAWLLDGPRKRKLFQWLKLLRLHGAIQAKQKDKQTISQLEKRLKAEQEARALAEKQLAEERKRKKMEEATAARAVALAAATRYG